MRPRSWFGFSAPATEPRCVSVQTRDSGNGDAKDACDSRLLRCGLGGSLSDRRTVSSSGLWYRSCRSQPPDGCRLRLNSRLPDDCRLRLKPSSSDGARLRMNSGSRNERLRGRNSSASSVGRPSAPTGGPTRGAEEAQPISQDSQQSEQRGGAQQSEQRGGERRESCCHGVFTVLFTKTHRGDHAQSRWVC